MIQQEYKDSAHRKENAVSTALQDAAVVGAVGLIAAHQPWGRQVEKYLGRVVDTARQTFSKSTQLIRQGQGTHVWTKSDYGKFLDHLKQNWADSSARVEKVALSADNHGSLAAFIRSTEEVMNNARRLARKQYSEDVVRQEMLDRVKAANLSKSSTDNVNSFIYKAVKNAENLARNFELIRQHKLEGQAKDIAEQIARDMQQHARRIEDDPAVHDKIKRMAKAIKREVGKNAYNIDSLERSLGTSRQGAQSAATLGLEILTGAHKMTWREAKQSIAAGTLKDTVIKVGNKDISIAGKMAEIEKEVQKQGGDEAFERLMQVTIDESNLFVSSSGNNFSKATTGSLWRDFLGVMRNTLPGKLFKVGDLDNALRISPVQIINITTRDPILQAKFRKTGENDKVHFRVGKDVYTIAEDSSTGELQASFNEDLNDGNTKFISGRYGFYHRNIEAMAGLTKTKISDNWLFRKLDIFQDREEYSGDILNNIYSTIFEESPRLKRFAAMTDMTSEQFVKHSNAMQEINTWMQQAGTFEQLSEETRDYVLEYMNSAKKISAMFRQNTYKQGLGALEEILKSTNLTQQSKDIFELLRRDDSEEMLSAIMDKKSPIYLNNIFGVTGTAGQTHFLNQDLHNILSALINTPEERRHSIELVTNELRLAYNSDITSLFHAPMGNTTYTFEDVMRRELAKEALLRQGITLDSRQHYHVDYDKINDLLQSIDTLTPRNAKELDKLAQYSIWQHYTKVTQKVDPDDLMYGDYYQRIGRIDDLLRKENPVLVSKDAAEKFRETFKTLLGDEVSVWEGELEADTAGMGTLEDVVAVNRSASPLDIVQGLNRAILTGDKTMLLQGILSHDLSTIIQAGTSGDFSKLKADLDNVWKGLTASREDMSGANLWTYIPFFTMKRLSDELNKVGLGFSSESTKSVADFAMSFMTKRILPVFAGITYLDWMDDTTREVTGTGLWQGFTAGIANADLTVRRGISALGMDDWLKQVKRISPIWQYWGDKDDYQGYEERRRYYQEGYTPIRKAAWWTWGGISEARGSEIQYWQPNIVRRAASNWQDESMYDGYLDKWSHSLWPTPANPLSPLFAVLDPYYLERKHKDDRPYLISGPMFTEGTPWGAILNPTLGALIKPEREEHPGRVRNGIDIVALLHNANESIRQRAKDYTNTNYLMMKDGQVSAVDFNVWNAPTPDTKIMTVQPNGESAEVYGGTYGIYGTGGKDYSFGSSGGTALGAYAAHALGRAPGGGLAQNLVAGFNSFDDIATADTNSPYTGAVLNQYILAPAEERSVREAAYESYFGGPGPYTRHGDIIQNEKGELGIYLNRPTRPMRGGELTDEEQLAVNTVVKHQGQAERFTMLRAGVSNLGDLYTLFEFRDSNLNPTSLVRNLNDVLKVRATQHIDSPYAIDESQGFVTGKKLSSYNPSQAMDLINDADTVADLINEGHGDSFVRNASTSLRLIGGIYGYMGSEAVGFGVHNEKIAADSSDMYAFNKNFWDLNLGGLGGAVSEIGRRFIPNFQRMSKINPLMNQMPDWLPERFRYGDPYSKLPQGEMRMPGKGYESLNELHPDMFSTEKDSYGAFDRMKILADIAPNSPEYRLWREIAQHTVTDPYLQDEMEEIKSRARQQGKKHDFYNYQVVGKNLDYKNVVVSEVLGYGKFRSGDTIYKVAGVSVKGNAEESAQEVLERYLAPGQEVTIAVDSNQYYAQNKDLQKTINAAVYIGGESLGETMKEAGDADVRKGDKSAAATLGNLTSVQRVIGYAGEVIGHLDIPIISDQWMRIRSPYESYLAEQIYGTPYQSWAHPIDTFLMPAIERAVHDRSVIDLITSEAFTYIRENERTPEFKTDILGIPIEIESRKILRNQKQFLHTASILSNRATLIGYAVANMLDAENAKLAVPLAHGMNTIATVAHMVTGGTSVLDMAAMGAYAGREVFNFMEYTGTQNRNKFMAAGAAAGAALRMILHPTGDQWIPDRVKKNWDMQDYWDRLNYIKYEGLYHEAARRAKEEEGVDVENVLRNAEDRERKKKADIKKLQKIRQSLGTAYGGKTNDLKDALIKVVNARIKELDSRESLIEGGKYTQSAVIYKKAAESTIYGLKNGASWSEIVTALPTNDREYFMEFVSEADPSRREKILQTVSPGLKRALQMSWGQKPDNKKDNESFFKEHYLPDKDWMGWRPDVDLDDIAAKTIDNEAMNLSDFGYYESSLREPGAINATPLPYNKQNRDLRLASDLKRILHGRGLTQVEVNVSERNTMGSTDIVANIGVWAGLKTQQKVDYGMYAWV